MCVYVTVLTVPALDEIKEAKLCLPPKIYALPHPRSTLTTNVMWFTAELYFCGVIAQSGGGVQRQGVPRCGLAVGRCQRSRCCRRRLFQRLVSPPADEARLACPW